MGNNLTLAPIKLKCMSANTNVHYIALTYCFLAGDFIKYSEYCDKLPTRPKCLVRASVVSTVPSTSVIVQRAVTNY
jgi:hypothetical protein